MEGGRVALSAKSCRLESGPLLDSVWASAEFISVSGP